eukprot:TRINITY_DN7124_c0_g1_i3.p1 TRINITY_DN7124_c0_g1~~TRINITY_DN7124_c0_g1_i3.p1  ORF type:complete len:1001 (-),score=185.63 TRINITY_DN7124_c0_g1_i3:74-2878(-)
MTGSSPNRAGQHPELRHTASAPSPGRGGRRTVPASAWKGPTTGGGGCGQVAANGTNSCGSHHTISMSVSASAGSPVYRDVPPPQTGPARMVPHSVQRRHPSPPPGGSLDLSVHSSLPTGRQTVQHQYQEMPTARRWPDCAAGAAISGYATPGGNTAQHRTAPSPSRNRTPALVGQATMHATQQMACAGATHQGAAMRMHDPKLRSPRSPEAPIEPVAFVRLPDAKVGAAASAAAAAAALASSVGSATGSFTPVSTPTATTAHNQNVPTPGVPHAISSGQSIFTGSPFGLAAGPGTIAREASMATSRNHAGTPQVPSRPVSLPCGALANGGASGTCPSGHQVPLALSVNTMHPSSSGAASLTSLSPGIAPAASVTPMPGPSPIPPVATGAPSSAVAAALAAAAALNTEDAPRSDCIPQRSPAPLGVSPLPLPLQSLQTPLPTRNSRNRQGSTGGLSTGSVTMASPASGRGVRESRQIPVQATTPVRQAFMAATPEQALNLEKMTEDVKDVHLKVQSIHSILTDNRSHADDAAAIATLKEQLQQARDAERAAQKAERERSDQLAETSRRLHEVTLRLNDADEQLRLAHEEASTNEQSRIDLQQAASQEQQRLGERQAAQLEQTQNELEEARHHLRLRDERIKQLHLAIDAAETSRGELEAQAAEVAGGTLLEYKQQVLDLQDQLEIRLNEIHEHRMRCSRDAEAIEILTRDNNELVNGIKASDREVQRLKELRSEQEMSFGEREMQLRQREHEIAAQETSARRHEQFSAALQQERVDFEAQRQEMEEQLERQQHELMRQADEQQQRQRRFSNTDQENRQLRQTVQQQKKWLWDLEGQLNKERVVTNFLTPGEYARMVKNHQRENPLPQQITDLRAKNMSLKYEADRLHKYNEVMRRHMPRDAFDRATAEFEAVAPAPARLELQMSSEPEEEDLGSP